MAGLHGTLLAGPLPFRRDANSIFGISGLTKGILLSLVCHYARIPEGKDSTDSNFERVPYDGASFFRVL